MRIDCRSDRLAFAATLVAVLALFAAARLGSTEVRPTLPSTDQQGVMETPPGKAPAEPNLSLHSVEVSPRRAPAGTTRWLTFELTLSDPAAGSGDLSIVFSYSILAGRETVFSSEETEIQVTPGKRALKNRGINASKVGSYTLLARVAYGAIEKTVAASFHVESANQDQVETQKPVRPLQDQYSHSADATYGPSATRLPTPPPRDPPKATVYLIRKKRFLGSAIRDEVSLDGQFWGQLRSGSYLEASVAPGSHLIEIGGPNHHKGFQMSQRITLQPGQVLYLFRKWGAGGAKTNPIDQSEAIPYLDKYKFTGSFQ
ncbi:MAG: hypothetical protein GY906_29820 [bacterium]|nr:hypothetical protein [bacterium]